MITDCKWMLPQEMGYSLGITYWRRLLAWKEAMSRLPDAVGTFAEHLRRGQRLVEQGLSIREGNIADATIVAAASSIKNQVKQHDSEMK